MKSLSIMIKPASSLCNMRCKYCFYANVSDLRDIKSHGIMSEETVEILLNKVFETLDSGDQFTIAFQGGEPTLAGIEFFQHFSHEVDAHLERKKVSVQYSLQTNGLEISDELIEYLKRYQYLVGISIDCSKDFHDLSRVDGRGNGTFSRILKTKEKFIKAEIPHNVLCVLTNPMGKHPEKVWNFLKKYKIDFVQFIPCLGDLQGGNDTKLPLESKVFSDFYTGLLPLWFQSLKEKRYISIRFFDDLFHLLLHRQVNSCGFTGQCGIQLVVEGDGSVYPCDFYVLDQWKLGDFHHHSLAEMQNSIIGQNFLERKTTQTSGCKECEFQNFCGGGCERMAKEMYSFGGFCGYQDFLRKNKMLIEEIAAYLSQTQG
ncbi:MAG: SPASM domain-containing protein [Eubacteriales bacterium]